MNNEQRYYDALKCIASYQTVDQLRSRTRGAQQQYGLDPDEAIEMAYENVLSEARAAIRGKRRPKDAQIARELADG